MSTLERLRDMLGRDFDLAPDKLAPWARLEDLDIDSLRMIEILFSIEDEFKVSAGADQAELKARLQTLQDLADYIDELVAQRAGAGGKAAP